MRTAPTQGSTLSAATRRRWTLVAATLGLGITILDETVVFLALPAIDRDLGIGLTGQQWVVNGYLLPLAALLLVAGSLADRYGRRRLFVAGLVGFGVASLAAGLAPSGGLLLAARVAQGVFAAVLMPSTLALLVATFRGEQRAGAIGSWAAWGGATAAVGPLVAGALIAAASWRWVFFLSLPIVAVAIGLALWAVPESTDEQARQQPLDLLGALLVTVALGAASYALVQGPESGWTAPPVRVAAVAAPVAGVLFLGRERRAPAPMLPLGLFASVRFRAANASTLTLYAAFNGNFFLLTIYLQTALGYSALAAGAATLPLTMLMLALSERFGRLGERRGPRPLMVGGQLLAAAGLGLLGFLKPGDGYLSAVLPGVVLFGTGLALTVAPLTNAAVSAVGDDQAGLASGVNNAAARLAGLVGVALAGLAFALAFRSDLPAGATAAPPGVVEQARRSPTAALDLPLPPPARTAVEQASVSGFRVGMWGGAGVAAAGALISLIGIGSGPSGRAPTRANRSHRREAGL